MNRILIVRTSAIGDIVFASPFPAVLRKAYPDAHIAWLTEPGLGALVADHPDVVDVPDGGVVELAESLGLPQEPAPEPVVAGEVDPDADPAVEKRIATDEEDSLG